MSGRRPGLVSVVLPAYDEEKAIAAAIEAITGYLAPRVESFEIVVADDGSRDRTAAVVAAIAERDPRVRLLALVPNRGKGRAVREGIAVSRGDVVVFLDVDLSTPIEMLERVWPALDAGARVVVGSRRMPGARIEVHQPPLREALGELFRRAVRAALGITASDLTCGFKAFDGPTARRLFARLRRDDWSFDVELLVAAAGAGLEVRDVPVVWRDDPHTKVRLWRDVPRSLAGVAAVAWGLLAGRYRRPLSGGS